MDATLGLTLFVELGRVREAADFYAIAFDAKQVGTHQVAGQLAAVELQLGGIALTVAGANPQREREPGRGGPFFPKAHGAVSTIVQLTVSDIDMAMCAASEAGAMIRNEMQADEAGRRVASVFDPFGHIWSFVEHKAPAARIAA